MKLMQGSDWTAGALPDCTDASVLAAAEGGDRVLQLLARAPKRLFVVDRHPAQRFLVELKRAGVQALGYPEYLELTGVRSSRRRRSLYQRVRWLLGREADDFWLARLGLLDRGIALQGVFERRLVSFRHVVRLIQGRSRCTRYLDLADEAARRRFLDGDWNTFLWRKFGRMLWEHWFDAPVSHLNQLLLDGRLLQPVPELERETFERAKVAANRLLVVDGPPEAYLRSLPARSVDVLILGRLNLEGMEGDLARVAAVGARATLVTERDPGRCLSGFVADQEPLEAGFFPGHLVGGCFS